MAKRLLFDKKQNNDMKKTYTSPLAKKAKTRLRATILAGSTGNVRPDGTPSPENAEGVGVGGSTSGFDARIRQSSIE